MPHLGKKRIGIGLDADSVEPNDTKFYEWISNGDVERSLGEFILGILDELKEDPSTLKAVIADWKNTCTSTEYHDRISVLKKLGLTIDE